VVHSYSNWRFCLFCVCVNVIWNTPFKFEVSFLGIIDHLQRVCDICFKI
jgi:hypothetical protein